MSWLPDGGKSLRLFTSFDGIHERDGHPDGRIPRDGVGVWKAVLWT